MPTTTPAPTFGVALRYVWTHLLTLLGLAQVLLAYIATAGDLFSPRAVKWVLLISGLLTVSIKYLQLEGLKPVPLQPATGPANLTP